MADIKRLGLGCMGMNFGNRERSINTYQETNFDAKIASCFGGYFCIYSEKA